MNVKNELEKSAELSRNLFLNDVELDPMAIRAVMINEVVPADPGQDFYGETGGDYISSALQLFHAAGARAASASDILQMGIYITNAVKMPKTEYAVEKSSLLQSLPCLERELALFSNVKVIMLMGDVAKKAFNMLTKKATGKNIVPSVSTYKLRDSELYWGGARVLPSYIMTGGNILIEKSKVKMITEDIAVMLSLLK